MVLPHRRCFQIQRWPGKKNQAAQWVIHSCLSLQLDTCQETHASTSKFENCIIRFPRPVYHLESEADREFSFTSVTKALGTDNKLITTIKSSKEIGDENILQMLKPIPPPTHTFQRLVALPILRSTDRLLRNICPTWVLILDIVNKREFLILTTSRYKAKNRCTRILFESRKSQHVGSLVKCDKNLG